MLKINYLAVVVAAVAAFVLSSLWYSPFLFGNEMMKLQGVNPGAMADMAMPAWKMLAEFVRSLVVAYVLARFVMLLGVTTWKGALRLGAWVWVFPTMILLGSVLHENVPLMLAAIHVGDWLVKLLVMAVILSVWRR